MKADWVGGNRFQLLENGEQFFPRVFEAIAAAEREVLIETFILFDDKVGRGLHEVLLAAAERGVRIDLTVDGYGSPDLTDAFVEPLTRAGVRLHVFDPQPRIFGWRYNVFRRMHRKIVVVDGRRAFVGGINYSADHLLDYGPEAKQDYAIEAEGPIVARIRRYSLSQLPHAKRHWHWFHRNPKPTDPDPPRVGSAEGLLVVRDNAEHRTDIERHYRFGIRAARRRIVIANAYFFPGYRLLHDLRRAARRGVDVRLILQGEPDMPIVKKAAALLYEDLLQAGVRIYEYIERPFHGKVALVDDEWSTVGSSNLDPLSLSLNLEANVMIRDRAFNAHLYGRLDELMRRSCVQVRAETLAPHRWSKLRSFFVYHTLRLYPRWAALLPTQQPNVLSLYQPRPESPA